MHRQWTMNYIQQRCDNRETSGVTLMKSWQTKWNNKKEITMNLNELRNELHSLARAKGWYDDPETDGQFIARFVANTHAELSELWEAHRKGQLNQQCDKDAQLTCLEEEMADIIIRTLDACGRLGVDIDRAVRMKHKHNMNRAYRHGGKMA